jgi:Zn-dependent metalloprotease
MRIILTLLCAVLFLQVHAQYKPIPQRSTAAGPKEQKQNHLRFRQQYLGVEVHGAEVILHEKEGKILLFNGRYYPTPALRSVKPGLDAPRAIQAALADVQKKETLHSLSTAEIDMVGEQIASSTSHLCVLCAAFGFFVLKKCRFMFSEKFGRIHVLS